MDVQEMHLNSVTTKIRNNSSTEATQQKRKNGTQNPTVVAVVEEKVFLGQKQCQTVQKSSPYCSKPWLLVYQAISQLAEM